MIDKFGNFNNRNSDANDYNFYYGKVVDIDDYTGSNRIKVRIKGVDDKFADEDLPWCISFLPLNISVRPQLHEMVKVILQNTKDIYNKREWLGSVISNYKNLNYESYYNALNNTDLSNKALLKKNNEDIFNLKDIAFNGRDNVDVLLKPKELVLRVGKHDINDKDKLNNVNPSTIRMRILEDGSVSSTSVLSDKILLITNEGGRFTFNKQLTDEETTKIVNDAYSATYAEPLIEFLKLIQDFALNHIHVTNLPPNEGVGSVPNIVDFNLERIKAKNIKIN